MSTITRGESYARLLEARRFALHRVDLWWDEIELLIGVYEELQKIVGTISPDLHVPDVPPSYSRHPGVAQTG